MKKLTLLFLASILSVVLFTSCGAEVSREKVDFSILEDSAFEGNFFPALACWNACQDDPSDLFYSFYLVPPEEGAEIRITIEETELNAQTVVQTKATSNEAIEICPVIKWHYDRLAQLSQSGTITMTCILEIDGMEIDRINHVVKYASINDCVYGMYGDEGDWFDTRDLFALYVNENYPEIDNILQEILAVDRSRSFVNEMGTFQDVINQVYWVWEYFSQKGTRYSNVTTSATQLERVGSQYVRFIDQSLGNNQANCVDGSVLLASIYTKIGLDCYLVFVPGHCKLAIGIDMEADTDRDGYIDFPDGGFLMIETTIMGLYTTPYDSYQYATGFYSPSDFENVLYEEDAYLVRIGESRANGIMPIKR